MIVDEILIEKNLFFETPIRKMYQYNQYIYKVALNLCGRESNKNECKISENESLTFKMIPISDDFRIIRTKSSNIGLSMGNNNNIFKYFGVLSQDLINCLDYFHIKNNDRMSSKILDSMYDTEKMNFLIKNKRIKSLYDFISKYNLEPSQTIRFTSIYYNRLKLFDFGLTQENYFNNMFIVQIYTLRYNNCCSFGYFKDFDGKYYNVLRRKKIFGSTIDMFEKFSLTNEIIIDNYKSINPRNNRLYINLDKNQFHE